MNILSVNGFTVVQFQIDSMGQMYLLFDNGSMALAEQEYITEDETIKVKIIKWFKLEDKD